MGPAWCLLSVTRSSSPCCAHAGQRSSDVSSGSLPHAGRGPLGVYPSFQAIVSGSWLVGLGSHCSIECGCKPELSPSEVCHLVFYESLLKWRRHVPPASSLPENSQMMLHNSGSSIPLAVLRRVKTSRCHFSRMGGKRGSLSLPTDAAGASRHPWIRSSGSSDLAAHDMETVSEPSRIGFARWSCHSPGKQLCGLPGAQRQPLTMLFEAAAYQTTTLTCSQEHITLQTGLKPSQASCLQPWPEAGCDEAWG